MNLFTKQIQIDRLREKTYGYQGGKGVGPFPILNHSVVPCPVLTVASWPAYPLSCKEIQLVHSKGDQSWCSLEGLILKLKLQYFGHVMRRVDSLEKTDAGRDWGQEEKGTTEDEMAGWHHRLDGHEFEWTPGVGNGQGGLVCCGLWGCKESDMTEQLNWITN